MSDYQDENCSAKELAAYEKYINQGYGHNTAKYLAFEEAYGASPKDKDKK